ncbi:uncharacterized protein LOC134256889 [Saccostrea cucullata]|uniref:uncharacterized protein LOC134256889 n=1 Tax=Saccostrea cuccullata TaxID=36930 RepID=UPI002ED2B939
MAESSHDYLEILPDEDGENTMNRPSIEIPLLEGAQSGSVDVDQVSPEFPMQSSGQYRPVSTAKTYDYADCPHQYEELPHPQLQPNGMSPDSVDTHSSNGTTVTSGIHSELEEGDRAAQSSEERKRFNPLYDAMINTSPVIYNKVNSTVKAKQDLTVMSQLRLLKIALLLLILISIASLFISIYVVIAFSDGPNEVASLKRELQSLQSNYTNMKTKMMILESLVAGNKSFEYISDLDDKLIFFQRQTKENISSLQTNLQNTKTDIIQVEDHLSYSFQNLTSIIESQNATFQEQLLNISKMQGPQGPQGVGNLSACFMKDNVATSPIDTMSTSTLNPFPPREDLEMRWFLCVLLCIPFSQAQSCSKYIDLIIVVESSNATSFVTADGKRTWHPAIQMFLTSLLDGITLGAEFFRVAIVLYSSAVDDVMTFSVDRQFAQHAISYLRPNFEGANLHMGLEEMNRMYQYYSRPGATKRALLVTGSQIHDDSSTFAEVWQARIMNVDLLAVGFGEKVVEEELEQIASDFAVTIDPVDGSWSSWMNWSTCTASCNGGYRSRARSCSSPRPSLGGQLCDGMPSQTEICNTHGCQDEWGLGSWSTWSDCSISCGTGRRVRTRWCQGQCGDREADTEFQSCSKADCPVPVDGAWSEWGAWSSCDCHTKTRQRQRDCSNPPPSNAGKPCSGSSENRQACPRNDTALCPENGSWSSWSEWSTCSKSCGEGISSRTRQCNKPPPRNGGTYCSGSEFDQRRCNLYTLCQDCPYKPSQQGDNWYLMKLDDSWVPQRCFDGNIFSADVCKCIADRNTADAPRCDQVLDLDFLSSAENTGVLQYDGRGNAVFNKDTRIVLWQFYQMELDSGFRLSARVKPNGDLHSLMTLISYGDCVSNMHPSITIMFQTLEEKIVKVIFGLSLQNKRMMSFLNVTTMVDDHLDLTLHFNGRSFGGEVNNKLTTITFSKIEHLQRQGGPLVLGKNVCSHNPGFQGLINQIQLYSC